MRTWPTLLMILMLAATAFGQPPGGGGGSSATQGPVSDLSEGVEAIGDATVQAAKGGGPSVDDPEHDSLASPRQTVLTFRENMGYLREGREQAWPRVRQTLAVPDGMSDVDLRAAADALDRVFDRFGEISPSSLPGRDAVQATGVGRVEVFPRRLDHRRLWQELGDAPDGEIVVSRGSDGDWQFEAGTVAGAADLLNSVRSVAPRYPADGNEMLQRVRAILRPTWEQTPWWGWFALGGCVAAGFVLGTIVARIGRRVGNSFKERNVDFAARAFREAGPALGFILFVAGVVIGSGFIMFGPTLSNWRWSVAKLLTLVALGYAIFKLAGIVGGFLANRGRGKDDGRDHSYAATVAPFVVEAVRFGIVLLFLAVVLQNLFGVSAGALVTSFGAVGLAIGLAAKESVRNWLGAMTIFFAKPFVVKDWIIFQDEFGQVERVSLNATHIRTVRGEVMVVPNMKFIDGTVLNANRRHYLRREMNIAVPYDSTPDEVDKALSVLREVLTSDEVQDDGNYGEIGKEPHITFQNFNSDHLQLRAYYWYKIPASEAGWYDFLSHNDLVNRRLFNAFDEAGLSFAFPTQTLRLTDDGDRGLQVKISGDAETGSEQN
jgi:MscS family membrane protein